MFNSVQYVREICQQKKIPISQLEKDCGFSNGYLNPKKIQTIPYERAKTIANYLNLSLDYLLNGNQEPVTSTPSNELPKDEDIMFALFGGDGEITPEMFEEVKRFAAFVKQREREKNGGNQS